MNDFNMNEVETYKFPIKKFFLISTLILVSLLLIFLLTNKSTNSSNKSSMSAQLMQEQQAWQLPDCAANFTPESIKSTSKFNMQLTCLSNNKVVNLTELLYGKNTILNLWSYDCPPCVVELPNLAALQSWLPANYQVLAVQVNTNNLRAFQQLKYSHLKVVALTSKKDILASLGLPQVVPQTLFINKELQVVKKVVKPYIKLADLKQDVSTAFKLTS